MSLNVDKTVDLILSGSDVDIEKICNLATKEQRKEICDSLSGESLYFIYFYDKTEVEDWYLINSVIKNFCNISDKI